MKRNVGGPLSTRLAVAVALALALPQAAKAQACLGYPSGHGQTALAGAVMLPDGGTQYGGSIAHNARGPLAVFGSYMLTTFDSDDVNNANTFGAGVAYDVAPSLAAEGSVLSVCPAVGAEYTSFEIPALLGQSVDISILAIPVGVGVGGTLPVGEGDASITPFLTPQVIWQRVSAEGESESETNFAILGGVNVGFSSFFVGGRMSKVFEEGSDAVFGVQFGVVF